MSDVVFQKRIPLYREVDVLVVGAGPAGICAATAAARDGARVLLIDENGCVGGAATVGLVGPFMTSFDARNEKMVIRGLFKEVVDKMKAMGGAIDPAEIPGRIPQSGFYKIGHEHVGPFDHECYKRVCTQMVLDSGAGLLLHTHFLDVMMEGGKIAGVVIANKSGMSLVRAGIVVDCTGDGDVAARAGAPFELGNAQNGNIQPATLFFRLYNVDTEKMKAHIKEHEEDIRPFYGPYSWLIKEKAQEWGDVPRAEVCLFEGVVPGEFRLNVTRILDVDGTSAEDLTRAELEGLRQAHKVFEFLKKYAAGFENARFMDTAGMVGVRESRHIQGIKKVTEADVRACRVSGDAIAVMATHMDTHNKSDAGGSYNTIDGGPYFGVPYGCLVPQGTNNLLVAGRCISADGMAGAAIRMIPCCMVFGQAAGTAAAMAVKSGLAPAQVDVRALRSRLLERGAYLGD